MKILKLLKILCFDYMFLLVVLGEGGARLEGGHHHLLEIAKPGNPGGGGGGGGLCPPDKTAYLLSFDYP